MCTYENTDLLTFDFLLLFKVSASLFVKELEAWFKSIANLVSLEDSQARGTWLRQKKDVMVTT